MSKTVKVLQVFASLNIGGAESRMMDVYRNIDREKFEFDFLSMQVGEQFFEKEINSLGGKVFKLVPPRESGVFKNLINIYNHLKINGPYDVVHAHTSHHCGVVLLAAKLAGVPIRISHARTTNSKHIGIKTKIMVHLGKGLIKLFSTDRLAISNDAATYLYGKRSLKKGNSRVLPNAIDTKKYFVEKNDLVNILKQKYLLEGRKPILGHVGRFEVMKNQSFLIEIMKEYVKTKPNSLLILIGDGHKKNEVEKLVKNYSLQDNVLFLGIRNDVNNWMKIFDIVVLPSLFEGLCGVAIEAQAAGTPCVLSKGIPQDVDLGLGLTKYLSLDDGRDIWIKSINKQIKVEIPDIKIVERRFKERGYTLSHEIENLGLIYCGGERYENPGNYYNNVQ